MRALVIAGGLAQIELLEQLRKRKVFSILIDGNENPLAKDYADKTVQVDIFNIDAVKEIAISEQVDFIITVCADQVLLVVAQVSELLHLPCYIDYKTAVLVSNKKMMKKIFWDYKIPTTKYVVCNQLNSDIVNEMKFPLVVKPVDAYSSRGVRKVQNYQELQVCFEDAQKIGRNSKDVIIEEFFQGQEISVDLFVTEGKAHILSITNSMKILDDGRFVIFRGKYPAITSDVINKKIENVSQQIVNAFHIQNAPMLVQLLVNNNDVSVIEFCARTGGNMKYLLIKHICGFDVISATIDLFLGKKTKIKLNSPENKYIANDFIYCKEGVFDHLEGFDKMLSEGYISDYRQIRPSGFQTHGATSSSDRVAGFTVQANTLEEFNHKHAYAVKHTSVKDQNGRDIMRHDLLPELTE